MTDNCEELDWSNENGKYIKSSDDDVEICSSDLDLGLSKEKSGAVSQENQSFNTATTNGGPDQSRQSDVVCRRQPALNSRNASSIPLDKLKQHFSSSDLSKLSDDSEVRQRELVQNDRRARFGHSSSCNNLLSDEKHSSGRKKYDHIESKVKQYFQMNQRKILTDSFERSAAVSPSLDYMEEIDCDKDYLEKINNRLTKELEEKNALLNKLQENYENLLLKYAEAQNKIDQLRLKAVCESSECPTHSAYKQKTVLPLPFNILSCSKEQHQNWDEVKCQKAVVAPFMKESIQNKLEPPKKADRPSSLPLETSIKDMDINGIKAGTPTDSEGVSSVITSMSGHSKILNILDGHSPNGREPKLNQYPERDFVLRENSAMTDAFDKVKNWQNSLPPLELIEKPETNLYDEPAVRMSPAKSNGVLEHGLNQSNCVSASDHLQCHYDSDNNASHAEFKEYLRTLSLPSALRKKSLNSFKYQKRNHPVEESTTANTDDGVLANENAQNPMATNDVPSGCIIIPRPNKRPPLLRCSSLPAYDYDSPKSVVCKSVYIPLLDLENLTTSEPSQVEYDYSKGNRVTSSSYITSQSGSMEFSSQTYKSNFFRGRQTDYTDSSYSIRPSFNKSTSISPDRCKEMNLPFLIKTKTDPRNVCHVCGEKFGDVEQPRDFPCRSNSYQSFPDEKDTTPKSSSERRCKHPFTRSISFNWETNYDNRCYRAGQDFNFHGRSQDSLEKFDIYANNLKARSQVLMKALAAHVNNT